MLLLNGLKEKRGNMKAIKEGEKRSIGWLIGGCLTSEGAAIVRWGGDSETRKGFFGWGSRWTDVAAHGGAVLVSKPEVLATWVGLDFGLCTIKDLKFGLKKSSFMPQEVTPTLKKVQKIRKWKLTSTLVVAGYTSTAALYEADSTVDVDKGGDSRRDDRANTFQVGNSHLLAALGGWKLTVHHRLASRNGEVPFLLALSSTECCSGYLDLPHDCTGNHHQHHEQCQ
ncbi:hypothetical protein V6N13_073384 [Hibiscus sabdariffa]|uniref:Uncharacterized protein n=2 Tax=Hibiscus sabdariffa TaxID=183260 RepID=A0ABR1ZHV5_9ROSI